MININTKNKSFLKVAEETQQTFMLELKNTELMNVDVYDPNIRREDKMAVLLECTINPWYYLREVLRIKVSGDKVIPFSLDRSSCAQIWLFLLGYDTFNHKSRQLYKTGSALGIISWVILFKTDSFDLLSITRDCSLMNLNKLNELIDLLPEWFTSNIKKTKFGIDNNTTGSAASIYLDYVNCTRKWDSDILYNTSGPQSKVHYYDDFEYIENIEDIYTNASVNNSEFGNIITSILGKEGTDSYEFAREILKSAVEWNESFYIEYYHFGGKKRLDEIIKDRLVHIEYPFYLIAKDPKGYYLSNRRAIIDEDKINREILLIDK